MQSPRLLLKHRGGRVDLSCRVQGASDPYMYWYRRTTTAALTFIVSSVGKLSVEQVTISNFNATRNSEQEFSLSSENIQKEDGGIYYCAWSHTAEE
ncbi:hypothetical protein GDO81_028090, partial [Engystomops pustulosus]